MSKLTITLLTAAAALSFGTAYAAGDKADKAPGAAAPADQTAPQKPMTKQEALQSGVSEEAFQKADTNGDGQLDANEIKAYNATKKQSK